MFLIDFVSIRCCVFNFVGCLADVDFRGSGAGVATDFRSDARRGAPRPRDLNPENWSFLIFNSYSIILSLRVNNFEPSP